MSKYGHRPVNWFEAIVNKFGGEEAAEKFLSDKLVVSKPTRQRYEKNGVIYFPVMTGYGTTGLQWVNYFGTKISTAAKDILCSPNFKPATDKVYEIAVLKGMLWGNSNRITKRICENAYSGKFTAGKKLFKPHPEVACLISQMFLSKDLKNMGLSCIVIMHEHIKDSDGFPTLLNAEIYDDGLRLEGTHDSYPDNRWNCNCGFAFAVSQVSV